MCSFILVRSELVFPSACCWIIRWADIHSFHQMINRCPRSFLWPSHLYYLSKRAEVLSHGCDFTVSIWTSSIPGFCVSVCGKGCFSFGHFWIYVFVYYTCPRGSFFSSNGEPYACIWFSHRSPLEQTLWITITHCIRFSADPGSRSLLL